MAWTFRRAAFVFAVALSLPSRIADGSSPPSLAENLRRAARSSVYLVEEAGGIIARSVAGGFRRTLVSGQLCAALYDASAEVIFFSRAGKMWAFDLRESVPSPVAVIDLRDAYRKEESADQRDCSPYVLQGLDGTYQSTNPESPYWTLNWKTAEIRSLPYKNPPVLIRTWIKVQAARVVRQPQRMWSKLPMPFGRTGFTFKYDEYKKDPTDEWPSQLCLLQDRAGRQFSFSDLSHPWSGDWQYAACHPKGYVLDSSERSWLAHGSIYTPGSRTTDGKELILGWLDPGPVLIGGSRPKD